MLILGGCSDRDRYVAVAEKTLPKTVMLYVDTIVEVPLAFSFGIGPDGDIEFDVLTETKTIVMSGAGSFISPHGHVLTCRHLFEVGESSTVTACDYSGVCQEATVLSIDPHDVLALLKIERSTPVPYIDLADPRDLRVGQEVVAIGNPLGELEFTVSRGIISALNRDVGETAYNLVQTDTPINPGNSGGPLVNLDGRLVGVVNAVVRGHDGLAFSVETGQIIEFLTRFRGVDKSLPRYNLEYWGKELEVIWYGKG